MNTVRLPTIEDRIVIIGQTGSGKTYGGLWHLSQMPIDEMPALIIDFKRDKNINSIPFAKHIGIGEEMNEPGVYIIHPRTTPEDRIAVTDYLWEILERGDTILFVDEGFMLADDRAFETILMQGRSKHIPVIINAQRPVWLSRFAFSEASFVQVHNIRDRRDRKTISEFTPLFQRGEVTPRLPDYWSWYYDVSADVVRPMKKVPPMREIMRVFREKLEPPELLEETGPRRVLL
jgi:hypothetical protein